MGSMNQGNWGTLLQGGVQGAQTEQAMQAKDYENQIARQKAGEAGRLNQAQSDEFDADTQRHNISAANNNANAANPQMPYQNYSQQSGGVFDPARNAIHSALANIGRFYQNVFKGPGQQGQSNPAAAQQGNPNAHAAGPAAQQTTQQPGNQAMSRPMPSSSNPAAGGIPGATGPMPNPQQDPITGRTYPAAYAEGGAIPGRKLAGIRRKSAKPGNVAKDTAGDKQVAAQQEMPPRNTEPGAGISNQDPQLADGGKPKKWIAGAIKHPGALHKELGVPEGEKIPKSKIKSAEGSDNPKLAKRAQLADTMSHFKDGGLPSLPKLQPGAAPAPKPAPRSAEQDVSNDGMRHYLGKTIKRFADGDQVKPDDTATPTPAGLTHIPPHQDPGLEKDLYAWNQQQPDYAGMVPPTGPSSQSPPQDSGASAAAGSRSDYTPEAPGKVPESKIPAVQQVEPNSYDQNIRGPQLPDEIARAQQTAIAAREAGAGGGNGPSSYGPTPESGAAPGAPAIAGVPHQDAPVDFSKIQADQSQVPTMSTQDWQMMHDSIRHMAVAHGMSQGQADIEAESQVSNYQHQNFMQYMQQAAALDAAGNKQSAMAAMKTAYQFFPTGHDMHFGLDPQSHDIIGYGVNEQTGQPVPNGAIHLNQQNIHGIITHFSNPENFVNEGIRMQQVANETAKTKGEIGLMGERGRYLHDVNPTRLAGYELRAQAAEARAGGRFADPHTERFYQGEFKDLPQGGEALAAAAQLERLYTERFHQAPDDAARAQIAGEVRSKYDPSTSPEERASWMQQRGIQQGQGPSPNAGAIPSRQENPYVLMNALSGG